MFIVALFTVIALIIVLPTFARYLDKQQELRDAKSRLSTVQKHSAELERELKLWKDNDYAKTRARKYLGYVMPGQMLCVVTDLSRGTAAERLQKRVDSVNRKRRAATPWYTAIRDFVKIAGQSRKADNVDDVPVIRGKGGADR